MIKVTYDSSDVPIPDQVAALPGQDISVAQESLISTNRSFRYTQIEVQCRSGGDNPNVCRSGYQQFQSTHATRVSLRLPTVPKHARKVKISVLFKIKPPLDNTVEIC